MLAAVAASVSLASPDDQEIPEERWLVGDLHVHVSPPDAAGHSTLTVASAIDRARRAGLDFVALTPHTAHAPFGDGGGKRECGQELVARLAREHIAVPPPEGADLPPPLLVVAGWEWTRDDPGHLGVLFADVAVLAGRSDAAERALAGGGVVIVNHPYFGPLESDDPLLRMIRTDRRWRPFADDAYDGAWNAIEVWHDRSVWVQRLYASREDAPAGTRMLSRSLAAWDAATKATRRRITAVGGSDAHGRLPYALAPTPVVSVRVDAADPDALRRGLRAAHVTFGKDGGAAARDFAATSDVAGERAGIGDALRATATVTLRWSGAARLIENGEDAGEFDGGTQRNLPSPSAFAFWRIEKPGAAAYSNMIYANLPVARPEDRD